ncbi:DNA-directed RNA polymerase [Nanoarchaeota archaeon]
MFYVVEIEDHVRVSPELFGLPVDEAVVAQLQKKYLDYIDKEVGAVVGVLDIISVGDGIIIPGDGAAFYKCNFKLLSFMPELQELVYGEINEITNFGAFMNLGGIEGMIHVSQTMDDFVSFSKSNTLTGKNSKRGLKKGDLCLARVVAVSYKTEPPKIGLTMRQPGLGKIEWIQEDKRRAKKAVNKAAKASGAKGARGGKRR